MDYRCPVCGKNLAKRRLSEAVVARMEIQCSHCKSTIRHNIHRSEVVALALGFGTFATLTALAYWLQSQPLMVCAFGAGMAGALALPLLEHTYLRSWPRYARIDQKPEL